MKKCQRETTACNEQVIRWLLLSFFGLVLRFLSSNVCSFLKKSYLCGVESIERGIINQELTIKSNGKL